MPTRATPRPPQRRVRALLSFLVCAAACDAPVAPSANTASRNIVSPSPSTAVGEAAAGYVSYFTGSTTDAQTTPLGGSYLAGGGTDVAAGMTWLMAQGGQRSAGTYGDVVVLRTSGSNGYNKWLVKLGANSVTSIVISSQAGANSAFVLNTIAKAEVIFIAGGDQSTYVNLWDGTSLQSAVNARVAAGYPIGGTSAGLAVLGEFVYAAFNASAVSTTVMADPYHSSVTLTPALFQVPLLANIITDTHFKTRDRMGRLLTFLARLQQDGMATAPRGIAVDEGGGVGVTPGRVATVFGGGSGAYFATVTSSVTRTCVQSTPPTPLTYTPVVVHHVPVGKTFDLAAWTGTGIVPYTLSVTGGTLTSSTGVVY